MLRAQLWQPAEKGKPVSPQMANGRRLLGSEITKRRLLRAAAGEAVPRTPCAIGKVSVLPRHLQLFPVLCVEICFLQSVGNPHGTDPVPNLSNRLDRLGILTFQFHDRILREID